MEELYSVWCVNGRKGHYCTSWNGSEAILKTIVPILDGEDPCRLVPSVWESVPQSSVVVPALLQHSSTYSNHVQPPHWESVPQSSVVVPALLQHSSTYSNHVQPPHPGAPNLKPKSLQRSMRLYEPTLLAACSMMVYLCPRSAEVVL
jgi:hypothetical protein